MTRSGSYTVERRHVSVICGCGAVALRDFPIPFGVGDDQAEAAARILLANTVERCTNGVDRTPACEDRVRAKRHLQLMH